MEGNCITSKGPAKLLPSTQKLYRITYIFCKALWSVFIQPFDTNLLARKATLTLQCICTAQTNYSNNTYTFLLTLQSCYKPLGLLWRVIKNKKVYIPYSAISNTWVSRLLNLEWTFLNIDTSWNNKTPIRLIETFIMVINLSRPFLQTQSFFIVSNQK